MRHRGFVGIAIVVVLIIGGATWASVPDSNGLIHACYLTSGNPNARGALRVINTDAGETCNSNESPIVWSQSERALYSKNVTFTFPVGPSSQTLECDSGDVTTGGGFILGSSLQSIRVEGSRQTLSLSGWVLTLRNDAGTATTAEIFVVCKDLTP